MRVPAIHQKLTFVNKNVVEAGVLRQMDGPPGHTKGGATGGFDVR